MYLAAGIFALELPEDLEDGVLVEADLCLVRRARVSGLGVRDEDLVVLLADEIRLAGDGGGVAAEAEEVLVFGVDVVPYAFQAFFFPVDQVDVLEHPGGAVEVGGRLTSALVMGLEPSGPLAGGFVGQELG